MNHKCNGMRAQPYGHANAVERPRWCMSRASSLGLVLALTVVHAQQLTPSAEADRVNVIVRFRESPDQAGLRRLVARGGQHQRSLELIRGAVFSVNSADLDLIAADPDVESIAIDHPIAATDFSGT